MKLRDEKSKEKNLKKRKRKEGTRIGQKWVENKEDNFMGTK